ncbi:MAG: hypothetical protein AAF328_03895 [Planctomycetota bacterium]
MPRAHRPRDFGREPLIRRLAVAGALALTIHGLGLPAAVGWTRRPPATREPRQPSPAATPQPTSPQEPAADLAVSQPNVPSRLVLGGQATLRFTVDNRGSIDANVRPDHDTPWWSDAAYLSTDATLDDHDPRIAESDALPRLSRGGSYDATLQAQLPAEASSGPAYVLLVTDHTDAVDEAGRNDNNILAVPVELRPVAETPPEVVLGDTTAAPRVTVAWISHEAFEELRAGPVPSETLQPALQRDATPQPDAPLRAGNAPPVPTTPATNPSEATAPSDPNTAPRPQPADSVETPAASGEPQRAQAREKPTQAETTNPPQTVPQDRDDHAETPVAAAPAPPPPTPSPPATQNPPQEPRPSSAPQGSADTDPADFEPVPIFRAGRVEVAEGLTVIPSRPDFSVPAIVASIPRNPRVRITFDTDGTVLDANLIDSAGSDMLNAPIRASLYRWRISGEQVATWDAPRQFTFTILLTRTTTPTP